MQLRTLPIRRFCHFLAILISWLLILPAFAQQAPAPHDSALARTAALLEDARAQGLDLLSPRHFERAQAAYDEARSLIAKKSQEELVHIRVKLAQDEIDAAQKTAATARQRFNEVLDARSAALASRSDSLSGNLWRKAEDRFRDAIRDFEKSSTANIKTGDLAGAYRAARRDALRSSILKTARDRIGQLEHKRGEKLVPKLVLRAQQAMSRAEADLSQENIDAAHVDAQLAERHATHALSMIDYVLKVRKAKQPWEAALLPYDDMLDSLSSYLGGRIDFGRGIGVYSLPQMISLVKDRQDSLIALTGQQRQSIKTLEGSMADAQTRLTDLNNQIANLQGRLGSANNSAQGAAITEQIARAQSIFHPGEAFVLQGENNSVVIRLAGSLFPSGATKLDKARQRVIDRVAEAVSLFPGAALRVEGHTDSSGTAEKNLAISASRAESVAAYLAAKLKVPATQIPAQGFGSARPVASNETADGRARNRRVDVVLVPGRSNP